VTGNPSPYVSILLYVEERLVRLADLLDDTATLDQPLKLSRPTPGKLLLCVDAERSTENVSVLPCDGQPGDVIRFLRG
jgi:hypothetical protein